jgi:hypothetical protein
LLLPVGHAMRPVAASMALKRKRLPTPGSSAPGPNCRSGYGRRPKCQTRW